MNEIIKLMTDYSAITVITIICLLFILIKKVIEYIAWAYKWCLKLHNRKNKKNNKEESVEDRIKRLEEHDLKQYERLGKIEETLDKITDAIESQQEIVADIKVDAMRREILDFASCCGDKKRRATREQYAYILRTYDKYEAFLKKIGRTNGEAELSIKIIQREYERNLLNNNFVDDGYEIDEGETHE